MSYENIRYLFVFYQPQFLFKAPVVVLIRSRLQWVQKLQRSQIFTDQWNTFTSLWRLPAWLPFLMMKNLRTWRTQSRASRLSPASSYFMLQPQAFKFNRKAGKQISKVEADNSLDTFGSTSSLRCNCLPCSWSLSNFLNGSTFWTLWDWSTNLMKELAGSAADTKKLKRYFGRPLRIQSLWSLWSSTWFQRSFT